MLFDVRTYTCKPGRLNAQLKLYEEIGLPTQTKHLGKPVFYCRTETGDANEYVHIWCFHSAADREEKRAKMQADPAWQNFLAQLAEQGNLVSMTNKQMVPVSFFDPPEGVKPL